MLAVNQKAPQLTAFKGSYLGALIVPNTTGADPNSPKDYQDELKTLLTEKFQLIGAQISKT